MDGQGQGGSKDSENKKVERDCQEPGGMVASQSSSRLRSTKNCQAKDDDGGCTKIEIQRNKEIDSNRERRAVPNQSHD